MSSADIPELLSMEDYLAKEEVARFKSEYIGGRIRAMTGASIRHNCIKGNFFILLGNALKNKKCRPYDSDTKLRIEREGKRRFYYPDVQVVCESNDPLSVFQDRPVLIIEVLSPSTRAYDLHEKLEAYQLIPSLECYIVLEQHQPIAYFWRRSKEGWIKRTIQGIESMIDLPILNCVLSLRDIYERVDFTDTCVQEPDPEYSTH
ncbi:MAG: Uma2 family endonuclease [Pirellula sp.]